MSAWLTESLWMSSNLTYEVFSKTTSHFTVRQLRYTGPAKLVNNAFRFPLLDYFLRGGRQAGEILWQVA